MIQQRQKILAFIFLFADVVLITSGFLLAYAVRSSFVLDGYVVLPVEIYVWLLWLILPLSLGMMSAFGVYSLRSLTFAEQVTRVSKGIGLAWLVLAAVLFFLDSEATGRILALLSGVISYSALVFYRWILFHLRRFSQANARHVVVIGNSESADRLVHAIETHSEWGLRSMGRFPFTEAESVLERGGVDELMLVLDRERLESCENIFLTCEELGVTATMVLNVPPHTIARMEVSELDGFPLLRFARTPTDDSQLFVRRLMDVVISSVLILLTSPLVATAALGIWLTSSGAPLFSQRRLGLHGRPFTMYKLRSMRLGAEALRNALDDINERDGPVFKSSRDPRITPLGKWLRRFSIDELPQLYNVIRGEMSLVGPRPPLPEEVARYEPWQRRRLSMKPGITGLWQVSDRRDLGFDEWMQLDLFYIDNWSLLLDLKILLKTIPALVLGRGAY